ncbi:hypothetical protein ACFQ07_25425, partial [Actinomadura adrarensis]
RARAGESLLMLPAIGDRIRDALVGAMTSDPDPTVRAELWDLLTWGRHNLSERLEDAEAIADEIAHYARSCTPPGLKALSLMRRLDHTDVLPELACPDLERRRQAAYQLARSWNFRRGDIPQDLLDEVVDGLLRDADPLLRAHGVGAVQRFGLPHFHHRLRAMQETETDSWVQHELSWCLGRKPLNPWDVPVAGAEQGYNDEPPF